MKKLFLHQIPSYNKNGSIVKTKEGILVYQENPFLVDGETLHTLYGLDESQSITDGDIFYNIYDNSICFKHEFYRLSKDDIKVVAMSNEYRLSFNMDGFALSIINSLIKKIHNVRFTPEFMQHFVDEYNKGNILTDFNGQTDCFISK